MAEIALRLAQAQALKEAVSISLAVMDLTDLWLPESHFDVILNFYFLAHPLWAVYKKSIKPGGFLLFETFVWQPDIEMKPDHYLLPGELRQAFIDWDILFYEEKNHFHNSRKIRRIAQLVARKPWQ